MDTDAQLLWFVVVGLEKKKKENSHAAIMSRVGFISVAMAANNGFHCVVSLQTNKPLYLSFFETFCCDVASSLLWLGINRAERVL